MGGYFTSALKIEMSIFFFFFFPRTVHYSILPYRSACIRHIPSSLREMKDDGKHESVCAETLQGLV